MLAFACLCFREDEKRFILAEPARKGEASGTPLQSVERRNPMFLPGTPVPLTLSETVGYIPQRIADSVGSGVFSGENPSRPSGEW